MNVVALAGGIGAARFLRGLVQVVDPARLTVIANTGDDITLHGLHVSPDLDTITYTLGGGIHPEQGWGRADEHFTVATELRGRYGAPDWFTLGDRDLATHLIRTEMLRDGVSLSDVTGRIADAWELPFTLVPMTDDPVRTIIETDDDRRMHFQEWWVGEQAASGVAGLFLDGVADATLAPGAATALEHADLVVLCPSNPVVSIGTILQVPGVRHRLRDRPVVGVSPIVGGRVVRGMADKLLPAVGAEVSAAGVAALYRGFLDGWVIDTADSGDAQRIRDTGVSVGVTDTIMSSIDVTTALARTAVELLVP
ncbi:2-phospho-L-lactate transferase [Euzebya tangerina]|uniref:2-phospho-L-lactate transferase n=1 Tax=Euzebya tangerina TaxID=591198 RepID=UPI000E3202DF|nr:2-phospho-L-lactate transferase [Euzebya tangerina]